MMLERFAQIRGYRIFRDFVWPNELENFGRFNLVYGWNGSGKTTLSTLFRALQMSTSVNEGQVEFIFDKTSITGRDLNRAALPGVRVFNREVAARSVFETTGGMLDQFPPVYVFGEESAEKQRQLDDLKPTTEKLGKAVTQATTEEARAQKELNEYATTTARVIKNLLVAPGGSFNNYNASDFRSGIARISKESRKLLTLEERQALLDRKDAQPREFIRVSEVRFPDLTTLRNDAREALKKTVVSNVIGELAGNADLSAWVRHGLAMHTNAGDSDTCKFCAQPLPASRLRRLEAHFNDEFRSFTHELEKLASRIQSAASSLNNIDFVDSDVLYPEFRKEYAQARGNFELTLANVKDALTALADAVKTKQSHVFEPLDLETLVEGSGEITAESKSMLQTFLNAVNRGVSAVAEYMGQQAFAQLAAIVEKHNERTRSFTEEINLVRDRLYAHELAVALEGWQEKQDELALSVQVRTDAEKEKAEVDKQIRELEATIREHRRPAEDLNRELRDYLGHDEIKFTVEDNGYRLERQGQAATNLSEGERTAIAFLYFLKSLEDRSFDLSKGIVVVDDPISSLDSNSIYSAFGFMKRKLCDAGQLFVLTHNYTFLRQVRNWFQHLNGRKKMKPSKFYMLRASNIDGQRRSVLEVMDAFLQDYESEYHYLFKRVVEASEIEGGGALKTYYELPNLARRLLEAFLVFKIPDEGSLHARLEAIEFDGPKKTRILRFVDTHSHAEQIAEGHDDASALAEAPNVLKDLLELIAACDKGHFDRMKLSLVTA